jgi:CubicO group peptidase (beta-lactamase class C family)
MCALAHTPLGRDRPAAASDLGVRSGAADPAIRVTSANWIDPPFNRWGFSHVRELTRTACVGRGDGPGWRQPERDDPAVPAVRFEHGGSEWTYLQALQATYTDAAVVVHRGEVVFEYYDTGISPTQPHLLMSVSKSLTASLIGVLVGEGRLRTDELVVEHVAELAGTSWEGCTVQHLLDMTGGVAFSEHDMDDPESDGCLIEQISGYTLAVGAADRRPELPPDTRAWIRSLGNQQPHGAAFVYRSILTDVLGWIVEEVTGQRFAEVLSDRVWSRLGAEHDADLIVDATGFPVVEGGLCVTARDLARFGQMHLQRGVANGVQVVPAMWIDRALERDQALVDSFEAGYDADPANPEAYYHDCWWVLDAAHGRYGGYGIGGQNLLIDRPSETVVVKLSSWPKRIDPLLAALGAAAHTALLDHLAGR